MTRITKYLAAEIVNSAMTDRKNSLNNDEKKLREMVEELIISKIPEEVKKIKDSNSPVSKYINTTRSVYFKNKDGKSYSWKSYITNKPVPKESESDYVIITQEEWNVINNVEIQFDAKEKEFKDDRRQLEAMILEMRTIKRLVEFMPDLAKFIPIPEDQKASLVVDASKVKDIINKR